MCDSDPTECPPPPDDFKYDDACSVIPVHIDDFKAHLLIQSPAVSNGDEAECELIHHSTVTAD